MYKNKRMSRREDEPVFGRELNRAEPGGEVASVASSWASLDNTTRSASLLAMVRNTPRVVVSATDCQRVARRIMNVLGGMKRHRT